MSKEIRNVEFTVIPGGQKEEPAGDYLRGVFGKDGHLAKVIPGYEPREGQISMARMIDNGIRKEVHVIAEGPTGTGKSLAYSAPASFHAAYHGKRICIVTANKNLQRQVYEKDLALLADAVPWQFTYAVRKGINSYLCARDFDQEKWRDFLSEGNISQEEERMVHDTVEWAENTRTGDFEESPGPGFKIWSQFSTTRDECQGRKCGYYDECFVAAAKAKADGADIIVTNYHLLFIHLKLGETSKVLPHFDVIILDEAHRAAKIAREFFGDEISFNSIYRCVTNMHIIDVRGYKKKGERLRSDILDEARRLWVGLGQRARQRKNIIERASPLDSQRLEELLEEASVFYREVANKLAPAVPDTARITNVEEIRRSAEAENYRLLAEKCQSRREELFSFRDCTAKGMVFFIEGSGDEEKNKWVKLKSKAIEVGGYMHHALFKRFSTVVQTSATLAIRGGNSRSEFEYVRREMGMNGIENIAEITVESPFDWPKQGLLVIPRSMPEYKYGEDGWDKAVCQHIEKVVNLVGGRTLGLFTSFRMMNMAAEHIRRKGKHTLYVQGEATNRELAERFQRDVGSVLFGTESFSEGVSIEGEACTCVILDKIPFITKDDPVMYGIEKTLKAQNSRQNSFESYSLPEAIISFKQRVGRLIRTVNDVGVVVVLDKRLHTKRYRHQFIKSVPFDRVHDDIADITPFLRRVGAL
jgi:ATP-dependent DNA helicase DinG